MVWLAMALVFVFGCVGGGISVLTKRREVGVRMKPNSEIVAWGLLYANADCDTLFLTPRGQVLVGGVAAVVFWGLYGPWANSPVFGGGGTPPFTVAQLVAPILMGIGGPDWLQAQSERRCHERWSRKQAAGIVST
jgi:hypothetical protein